MFQDSSVKGYYHFSGEEDMTRYLFSVGMAEACGLPSNHIVADKNAPTGASRPQNSKLACDRLEKLVDCKRTPFKIAVKECLQPFL